MKMKSFTSWASFSSGGLNKGQSHLLSSGTSFFKHSRHVFPSSLKFVKTSFPSSLTILAHIFSLSSTNWMRTPNVFRYVSEKLSLLMTLSRLFACSCISQRRYLWMRSAKIRIHFGVISSKVYSPSSSTPRISLISMLASLLSLVIYSFMSFLTLSSFCITSLSCFCVCGAISSPKSFTCAGIYWCWSLTGS